MHSVDLKSLRSEVLTHKLTQPDIVVDYQDLGITQALHHKQAPSVAILKNAQER